MEQSNSIGNIAAALSSFQGEVDAATKSGTNKHLGKSYATLLDIWDTIRVPLVNNGLAVSQLCEESVIVSKTRKFTTSEAVAISVNEEPVLMVSLTTILMHTSGEWIKSLISIPASKIEKEKEKIDPQAAGSAITYARRYALAAILGINQEDDDGQGYSKEKQQARLSIDTAEQEQGKETQYKQVDDLALTTAKNELLKALKNASLDKKIKDPLVEAVNACVNDYDIGILTKKVMLAIAKAECSETMKKLVHQKIDRFDDAERRKRSCQHHLGTSTIADASDIDKVMAYHEHLKQALTPAETPEQKARRMVEAMQEGEQKETAKKCIIEAESNGAWDFIIGTWGANNV